MTDLQPVLVQKLEPLDRGYDQGYRFRIIQIDADAMYFSDWDRVLQCIKNEGLKPITDEEMESIREEIFFSE
jgi:hypothetical protein